MPPSPLVLRSVDGDDYSGMHTDEMQLTSPIAPPCPPPLGSGGAQHSFTYTSGMDLQQELAVQGDMLERVSAQQRYILDELHRMQASHGLPLTSPPRALQGRPPHPSLADWGGAAPPGAPFRAAPMCA